jgi:hypothetical protein
VGSHTASGGQVIAGGTPRERRHSNTHVILLRLLSVLVEVGQRHPLDDWPSECLDDDLGRDISDQRDKRHLILGVEFMAAQPNGAVRWRYRRFGLPSLLALPLDPISLVLYPLLLRGRQSPALKLHPYFVEQRALSRPKHLRQFFVRRSHDPCDFRWSEFHRHPVLSLLSVG